MDKSQFPKKPHLFTLEERRMLIQEYLSSGESKSYIWYLYTGQEEHGRLLKWMRQLGYVSQKREFRRKFDVTKPFVMADQPNQRPSSEDENFELMQLRKRVQELERELNDAKLKAIAFSTMVDIAEKEFKIPIRKKLNTKP